MKAHPGHKAILGVLGFCYGESKPMLLVDSFEYSLADHICDQASPLLLSNSISYEVQWLKVLHSAYHGLHYVKQVGRLQLVVVSPKHLIHGRGR